VPGARAEIVQKEGGYVYEVAVPWRELGQVPHDPGDRIRMNVVVQDGFMTRRIVWSQNRSAARINVLDSEPGWGGDWSNDTWWGFAAAALPAP
jgi:hypothetical protein